MRAARRLFGSASRLPASSRSGRFFKEWFSAEPRPAAVPHLWRYADLRLRRHGIGRRRLDGRRRAARARARESRPRRTASRDRRALRGLAAHHARGVRARAPAHRRGAAFHRRRREHLHRRRRRALLHAARRLHRDAVVDLARPSQREQGADDLARRARRAVDSFLGRRLLGALRRARVSDGRAARRQPPALRAESAFRSASSAAPARRPCSRIRSTTRTKRSITCARTASGTPATASRWSTSIRRRAARRFRRSRRSCSSCLEASRRRRIARRRARS